jgi:hypothetical protein
MSKLITLIAVISIISISCASVNAVRVCSSEKCATAWYDEDGLVVTAAHAFSVGEEIDVESPVGYTDRSTVIEHAGIDTAYAIGEPYRPGRCYDDAKVGDLVTVSVWNGIARRQVTDIRPWGYVLSGKLDRGDSGAPVTRRGCIIGMYYGDSELGSIVVKTPKNREYRRIWLP